MKVYLTESLVFSAPVASHDFQKTNRSEEQGCSDRSAEAGAELDRGRSEFAEESDQRATQREVGGWARAGRRHSSQEQNDDRKLSNAGDRLSVFSKRFLRYQFRAHSHHTQYHRPGNQPHHQIN